MSFKDHIAADIATFINSDEFADEHTIDGVTLPAVVDSEEATGAPLSYAEGVFADKKTVYVNAEKLGYLPVEEQLMQLDDVQYIVRQVNKEMGMLVIKLERNADAWR